ncbi:MAG: dihydrolipoyl dehydrogenase [Dehalococcoidia bacterium]|nr:dihydrolipoyl dehydrogenase [Dehalococcoidia bacterium]
MRERYQIAFLGGGPAGYQGAIRAAQLGVRVAVVEEKLLGGVCLNKGCIPTKTVRASAEIGRSMRRAQEYGFQPVEAIPDMTAIIARKERVVASLRWSIERLFQAHRIDLVEGKGRLISPHKIEVEKDGHADLVEAEKVVISTGSRPATPPAFQQEPGIFLADEIFNITSLPSELLVVGGGAIGVEMAAIFQELGTQVTLIEAENRLLPSEDAEMSDYLQGIFRRRRVKTICGVQIESATKNGDQFSMKLSDGATITSGAVLLAVGRHLNIDGIGLEDVGIDVHKGHIKVDEHLQTTMPGVYAAGDAIGGWLLAHVAFAEGICAAECALGRESRMDYRVVPRSIFSMPEYSAVGLSEEEAQNTHNIKVARFPFKSLGMGQAMGEVEGLVKIITDSQTDQILGAHIIGAHASDLVSEIALSMQASVPSSVIMETIHIHPTLSEAVLEVAQALHGQAIHIPPQEMA